MAAILKAFSRSSAGVVTFTTQERDRVINEAPDVRASIQELRERWLIGLHHNWHDHSFRYDPLFDFSLAGPEDLRPVDGRPIPIIPLDACNFTPGVFHPGRSEAFWDVLFVARAVFFKRIPEFFKIVRALYDEGHELRVLLLSPVPPYDPHDEKTAFYGIRNEYERLFGDEEQDRFTLITMDWRYPFPLDLPTLAHFYRSSRVFVHTADDERRCRVAAYAWSSGLPVVGAPAIGSLLPEQLRQPPWFFEASDNNFVALILKALEASPLDADALAAVRQEVSSEWTRATLIEGLAKHADARGLQWDDDRLALERLDIRLGRHHGIGDPGPNRVDSDLRDFIALLTNDDGVVDAVAAPDPETLLARRVPLASREAGPRARRWWCR